MASRSPIRSYLSQLARFALPGLAAILACLAGFGTLQSLSNPLIQSPPPPSIASALVLIVRPDPIMLGILDPGQDIEERITLSNPQTEAVVVERIATSCPCLSLSPSSLRVEPQSAAQVILRFDPAAEPDFRGELSVELTGYGTDEERIFQTRVDLEVRQDPRSPM